MFQIYHNSSNNTYAYLYIKKINLNESIKIYIKKINLHKMYGRTRNNSRSRIFSMKCYAPA